MKRLSSALDRQATQASSGGSGDTLLGRNGSLLGRQSMVRGLGIYWAGSQLNKMSD